MGAKRKVFDWWETQKGLDDGEIVLYLASFIVLLLVLLLIFAFGAADKGDAFDFASYAFPCIAGIVGGVGLFHGSSRDEDNKRDKFYYSISSIVLFLGLGAYLMAHDTCRSSAMLILAAFYIAPTAIILVRRFTTRKVGGVWEIGLYFSLSLVVVLSISSALGGFYALPDLFVAGKCVDQARHHGP